MELKRKYRETPLIHSVIKQKVISLHKKLKLKSMEEIEVEYNVKQNGWLKKDGICEADRKK
jgi:hypothetical protein